MNPCLFLRVLVLLGVFVMGPTTPAGATEPRSTVLFLCPYGGAKSVIAASYFNRLISERGLPFAGVAAATEEPYDRVPPVVAALLAREGIDVSKHRPRRVENEELGRARRIIAIDCDLSKTDIGSLTIERWDDVPKVSEDLPGAMRAIRGHVEKLVQEMAQKQLNRSASAEEVGDRNIWPSSSIRTCIPP